MAIVLLILLLKEIPAMPVTLDLTGFFPNYSREKHEQLIRDLESGKIPSHVASDEVKRIMKYHGMQSMTTDPEKRETYFFRDGKKVKVALPKEEYDLYDARFKR